MHYSTNMIEGTLYVKSLYQFAPIVGHELDVAQ